MAPQPTANIAGWTISSVADVATLVGLAITFVGFIVTIWNVVKSRSAAERAQQAAENARSSLLKVDSIAGLSGALGGFDDLKRLHRSGTWEGMPERYATQRRILIAIRTGNPRLTDAQKAILQSAIQQLSGMEKQIEEHLANPTDPPDAARLNGIVSRQCDNLTQLLTELKIDGDHHEQ